jgi:uncharacterized protein YkwD
LAAIAVLCTLATAHAVALPTARAAAGCAGAGATPNGHNAALIDSATMCIMNRIRVENGMRPLHLNHALARIASGQARDMVHGHYFADHSMSGQTPLARIMASRYVSRASRSHLQTAQNIGWGTGPSATPAGIVDAWMHSPPHRQIMLTPGYRDAGVGVSPSVPSGFVGRWAGGTYAVEFGTRH